MSVAINDGDTTLFRDRDCEEEGIMEVRNLQVAFKGQTDGVLAVDDVSFTIDRGETVGFTGESGSGKSTVALACIGLLDEGELRYNEGEVIYNSRERGFAPGIRDWRYLRRDVVGYVGQDPLGALNPVLTIRKQ